MREEAAAIEPRPVALRRALVFIHTNAHRDIGVADIAAAAALSVRSTQIAFRSHLGTTPLAHLRRVRLDRARDALRAGNPETTSVAEVATQFRCFHLGRFAADYHAAFGELPSTTLASRRR